MSLATKKTTTEPEQDERTAKALVDGEDRHRAQERFEEDHRQGRGWFR